jgi:hypothetical protein
MNDLRVIALKWIRYFRREVKQHAANTCMIMLL